MNWDVYFFVVNLNNAYDICKAPYFAKDVPNQVVSIWNALKCYILLTR